MRILAAAGLGLAVLALVSSPALAQNANVSLEASEADQIAQLSVDLRTAIDAALAALPADASAEEVTAAVRAAVIAVVEEALDEGVSMEVVLAALQALLDSGYYDDLPVVEAALQGLIEEIAATGSIGGLGAPGGNLGAGAGPGGEFEYRVPE